MIFYKTMKNIEESAIIYKNYALNIVIFASLRYPFHEEVENMEKVLVFGHKTQIQMQFVLQLLMQN